MSLTKVTSNVINDVDASKLTGSIADARVPASAVTQHSDTSSIENDIAVLALQNAINGNMTAHGLNNYWIEQFEDSNSISLSTAYRHDDEYVGSGSYSATAWPYTNYADQAFAKFGSGWDDITTWNNAGTTHLVASNNESPSGYLAYASSPSGYNSGIEFDYLTAYTWVALDIGFRNTHGFVSTWRLEKSDNGTDWTIVDQTGSTSGASGESLTTNSNLSITTDATGVITNSSNPGNSPATHGGLITFGTPVTARHLRINVGSSSSNANGNAGIDFFIPKRNVATVGATGSVTSNTITPQDGANKSSIGLVVLYKENAGSTTLNTNLVAKVRANTGQAYQAVTLANKGTFSTGIKIAIAPAISVTAGQALSYEISFAGQSSGSLETQVHGVALSY